MQQSRAQPTLESLLEQIKQSTSYDINCHRIGFIVSFNEINQRAIVQLVDKIKLVSVDRLNLEDLTPEKQQEILEASSITPAPLINVPVKINATLKGGITIPIKAGDFCIIEFNDRDLTNWLLGGANQINEWLAKNEITGIDLASDCSHSFSDAIAIVGIFPNEKTLSNYNNNATEVFYENTKISLDNKIGISNSSGSLLQAIESLTDAINSLGEAVKSAQTIPAVIGIPLTLDSGTQSNISSALMEVSNSLTKFQNLLK